MDAQSNLEQATIQAATPGTAVVDAAAYETIDVGDLLEIDELEAALNTADRESLDLLEESIRNALEGISEGAPRTAQPTMLETPPAEAYEEAVLEPHEDAVPEIAAAGESLEAVELELALHNQNLVSLGFEESIRTALEGIGGEVLFQMRMERDDCQRIAAVRIGEGQEQQLALVIMPPGGGLMRVEPVEQSSNPLAMITESYAGLVDVFRAAA